MWLRIVRARRSASTTALTVSPTRRRPCRLPAVHDEGTGRPLGLLDAEERRAAARFAQLAAIADLSAALRVERRPIQDHLRLAGAGQLVIRGPVAQDGQDAASAGVVS